MLKSLLGVTVALSALLVFPVAGQVEAATIREVGRMAPTQSVDFIVKLPLRDSTGLDQLIHLQSAIGSPLYHRFLTPAQFRAAYGPTAATFARAASTIRASGFSIASVDSQMIHVRGTSAAIEHAFATRLGIVRESSGRTKVAFVKPMVPLSGLVALGATVAGLAPSMRPQPMYRRAAGFSPDNRYSSVGGYWFDDLKQAYQYPAYGVADGKGVTVATVGESDYSSSDVQDYFVHEKLGPSGLAPAPKVSRVLLPGASKFDPTTGISDEADLDVQQVGGSAPGANVVGVAVGGTGEPFLNAYAYLDETNRADIVSTSYGQCELYYTSAYTALTGGVDQTGILTAYHDLFRQGNAQGITFVFSSGDESGIGCFPPGYFDNPGQGKTYHPIQGAGIWVDDPDTTGVGGTNLITKNKSGSLVSTYDNENEIGDRITTPVDFFGYGNYIQGALWGSGGGYSTLFPAPSFQQKPNLVTYSESRMVPDVSMTMGGCPLYGPNVNVECGRGDRDSYDIAVIGGQLSGLIGTSASAPEFAGLLAVKESIQGSRLGNENEDIYSLASANYANSYRYFHQGIRSYNGVQHVASGQIGYNTTVGVGTPISVNFLGIPLAAQAGDPQTTTNP